MGLGETAMAIQITKAYFSKPIPWPEHPDKCITEAEVGKLPGLQAIDFDAAGVLLITGRAEGTLRFVPYPAVSCCDVAGWWPGQPASPPAADAQRTDDEKLAEQRRVQPVQAMPPLPRVGNVKRRV
jgi:hypothetical protein